MKIVVTGSLGNVSKPLTQELIAKGHSVVVISSNPERQAAIEALGAQAATGSVDDVGFLAETFKDADVVYLMEPPVNFFDHAADLETHWTHVAKSYAEAISKSGVTRAVHLSSVGAHTDKDNTLFAIHYKEEQILRALPETVSIKFMRPVGFSINLYRFLDRIRSQGAIIANYGGDRKEPWVSPLDIASAITEEMESPFEGRTVRYIASEALSPNEVATIIGEAIGKPGLKWVRVPEEQVIDGMLAAGMNPAVARGFAAMQTFQGSGRLYEDYDKHQPVLGKTKFREFAREFARVYHQQSVN